MRCGSVLSKCVFFLLSRSWKRELKMVPQITGLTSKLCLVYLCLKRTLKLLHCVLNWCACCLELGWDLPLIFLIKLTFVGFMNALSHTMGHAFNFMASTRWVLHGFDTQPRCLEGNIYPHGETLSAIQRSFLAWGWAVPLEVKEVLVSAERRVMMSCRALLIWAPNLWESVSPQEYLDDTWKLIISSPTMM